MPVETQLDLLFEVLEGGKAVTGEVIPFPTDAGATALEGITETVELGNGVATEVSQLTAVEGGAATTAGVGVLGLEVGVAGAAIAPALGILAGVGLYSLAPEFWTKVSNTLVEAGETIGGKVRAFINGDNRTVGLSEATIEIFKNAFLEQGIFDPTQKAQSDDFSELNPLLGNQFICNPAKESPVQLFYIDNEGVSDSLDVYFNSPADGCHASIFQSPISTNERFYFKSLSTSKTSNGISGGLTYTHAGKTVWYALGYLVNIRIGTILFHYNTSEVFDLLDSYVGQIAWVIEYGDHIDNGVLQDNAVIPDEMPFPQKYPTWTPYILPDEITKVFPIEIPVIDPAPLQDPAQNPQPLPDNDPALLDWLIDALNLPQADPALEPLPLPALDPDAQPMGDPIEEPTKPNTKPDPVDPNPEPTTPYLPIVPQLPDSVPANAMFTVYKPAIAQVNAFGGWLWSNSIIEAIKRIWQNPLDGVIAFMKVYVDAPTSGSDTIKVGVLDSEVSSAIVTGQFVTVECGTIDIEEKFFNATDYSPFVALHLYLPFIGIVELDIDEFMGGSIKVTYHVDVYTGTCLAEVKAKRNHDMDDYTIVYTFSGNASQQLPLTSAEFGGALSALVGVVGGGLAIASGGGLGLLAGASGIAHAVTHEMVHLAHSGSLSANAGIMGARTPYLIITRRRGYDANGYNQIYGYPSNKTVYLNNCSGLVKVKDIQLNTGATDLEANEIVSLLKDGVIV